MPDLQHIFSADIVPAACPPALCDRSIAASLYEMGRLGGAPAAERNEARWHSAQAPDKDEHPANGPLSRVVDGSCERRDRHSLGRVLPGHIWNLGPTDGWGEPLSRPRRDFEVTVARRKTRTGPGADETAQLIRSHLEPMDFWAGVQRPSETAQRGPSIAFWEKYALACAPPATVEPPGVVSGPGLCEELVRDLCESGLVASAHSRTVVWREIDGVQLRAEIFLPAVPIRHAACCCGSTVAP